jgi:hypothetical protein
MLGKIEVRCTVDATKAKGVTIRTVLTLGLACAAVILPACGDQDTPDLPPGGPEGGDCGGFVGATCPTGKYCDYAAGSCGQGDMLGTCREIPSACAEECTKICGCDGRLYCNACLAHLAGVDDSADRTCFDRDLPDAN